MIWFFLTVSGSQVAELDGDDKQDIYEGDETQWTLRSATDIIPLPSTISHQVSRQYVLAFAVGLFLGCF